MTYFNAKKYILNSSKNKKLSQKDFERLQISLGTASRRMKHLRLLGSNGKSVCAEMLCSIITHTSHTVGCLRMPMRDEPRECITINGTPISMERFAYLAELVRAGAYELGIAPTSSEILLSIALIAFKDACCELCITECTNSADDPILHLPVPIASVICGTMPNGDNALYSKIRSYICKGTGEVISLPQSSSAFREISNACYAAGCRLTIISRSSIEVGRLSLRNSEFTYKGVSYSVPLCGRFEVMNASLAVEVCETLSKHGIKLSRDHITGGLAKVKVPDKMEVISIAPLIIIDSAHDSIAVDALCSSLGDICPNVEQKIRLCMQNSELADTLSSALKQKNYIIENSLNPDEYKTHKLLAKAALFSLERDATLIVSGDFNFADSVRYQILSIMGF